MQLTPQEEQQERESGEMLASMMGGNIDPEVARRVLRKHNGNIEKAADAILGGDRDGEDWNPSHSQAGHDLKYPDSSIQQVTQAGSSTVIDLTDDADDSEFTRASNLSRETIQTDIKFGPSDRAPDPAWQIVPSNVQTKSDMSHDEQTLKQAIQASLKDFVFDEADLLPLAETVREGGRPVALRPERPSIAYAALVIQGFFFVPQVRECVANLSLPVVDENIPRDTPNYAIWNLVEIFVNMDLAQLSALLDKEMLASLEAPEWSGPADFPGDLSTEFLTKVAHLIEYHDSAQALDTEFKSPRLFNFHHGRVECRDNIPHKLTKTPLETCVVPVIMGSDPSSANDLLSRLSASLSSFHNTGSSHDVIFEPSQVVTFHLKSERTPSQYTSSSHTATSSRDGFIYPRSIYMDQFLYENLELSNEKRVQQHGMLTEIDKLSLQKRMITQFNDKDTLKDLRSCIYYFEHVAEAKGNPERQAALDNAIVKIKNIMGTIESEVEAIDRKIAELREASAVLFDCPELQKHRYDLRVVLMHSGVPGRKQIYSYVQDEKGVWWKTVDYTVTEVSEEMVLTDPVGLHLGAGPYMLIYSRSLPDEQIRAPLSWPEIFKDRVEENNQKFLASLPPDIALKAVPRHPPTSLPTPPSSPAGTSTERKEPPSREASMDVSGG